MLHTSNNSISSKSKTKQYEILTILAIAAIAGGGTGAFSKLGLESFDPSTFIFLRFLLAAFILIPVLLLREKKFKLFNTKILIFISLLATANVTLFIFGVNLTTATISQTLYSAVPLFSALITVLFLKEKLSKRKELGLLLGFFGVLIIIFLPMLGKSDPNSGTLIGNLLVLAAVTSVTLYFILSKKLQKFYTPLALTTVFVVITALIQSSIYFLRGANFDFYSVGAIGWASVFYVGAIGTGLYYILYQYAIKKASPVVASLSFYIQPIAGIVWAAILLDEKVTPGFVIGAILALTGVYLVTYKRSDTDQGVTKKL